MDFIDKYITTKKSAIMFSILFLIFLIAVLPQVSSLTTEQIGVSESPDTSFSFDIDAFYDMLENYGKDGRRFYIAMRWTFDVIWPLVYGLFLASTIGLLATGFKQRKLLIMIPFFAVVFDFVENIFSTITMAIYPVTFDVWFYLLKGASFAKWGILSLAFVIQIALLLYVVINKLKKPKSPN